MERSERGLVEAMVGDGRPLLLLTGLCLVLAGAFALFQSATGHFLPHDVDFIGMDAKQLCAVHQCKVVHFMFHDRVSFGGVLVAIGGLYMWLAEFPLREGEAWAWWVLLVSGAAGFASFLTYLGYGYLDTWHGVATLFLLPCFGVGLWKAHSRLKGPRSIRVLLRPGVVVPWVSRFGVGRALLIATGFGLIGGGLVIMTVGMTVVFVPQDLTFMGLDAAELERINRKLIPLIAHDRAGFGGGVCVSGILLVFCAWCGRMSRSLWQVLVVAGAVGFGTAIGIHPMIGYTDALHLAPAVMGAATMAAGLVLMWGGPDAGARRTEAALREEAVPAR